MAALQIVEIIFKCPVGSDKVSVPTLPTHRQPVAPEEEQ